MQALKKEVAVKLKTLREGLGISQEQLAEELGWESHVITFLEKGKRSLKVRDMSQLCDYFKIPVDDLIPKIIEVRYEECWGCGSSEIVTITVKTKMGTKFITKCSICDKAGTTKTAKEDSVLYWNKMSKQIRTKKERGFLKECV